MVSPQHVSILKVAVIDCFDLQVVIGWMKIEWFVNSWCAWVCVCVCGRASVCTRVCVCAHPSVRLRGESLGVECGSV